MVLAIAAMAFIIAVSVGLVVAKAPSNQALPCDGELPCLAQGAPIALLQLQTHVNQGNSHNSRKPLAELTPVGRTFLSTDPVASAMFFVEYYHAELVTLPSCKTTQRAAVRMPSSIQSAVGSSPLIVFIKDRTLPEGDVDIKAIVGLMNSTLVRASLGERSTYWFPMDNHDGYNFDMSDKTVASQIANGVPVGGYSHGNVQGLGGLATSVQIPHTMQTVQVETPKLENLIPVVQYDCRGTDKEALDSSWWKSAFSAANPKAAADFAVRVLGAKLVECPYLLDAPRNCTSAAWVQLPGLDFELHFVKSSGFQQYLGEIDSLTQQVLSLRNITAGVFDLFMYNSLILKVSSLDPWIERFRTAGLPFLVVQATDAEYALFVNVPENNIIIQLRSDRMSADVPVVVEMCAQGFHV